MSWKWRRKRRAGLQTRRAMAVVPVPTPPPPAADAAARAGQLCFASQRHILGKHAKESWLLSLSLKLEWAIFFAIKSIRLKLKKKALIIAIDVQELGDDQLIINCSSQESTKAVGIRAWTARVWGSSAREVLVESVPGASIKDERLMCLDPTTTHGQTLLNIEGKDRETDICTGEITKFGCFSEWLKAFEARFPDEIDREWLLNKLIVPMPSSSLSRSGRSQTQSSRSRLASM